MEAAFKETLFGTVTKAIQRNKRQPCNVVLISEVCRTIWCERTTTVFSQCYLRTPHWVVLQNIEQKLLAMKDSMTFARKMRQL